MVDVINLVNAIDVADAGVGGSPMLELGYHLNRVQEAQSTCTYLSLTLSHFAEHYPHRSPPAQLSSGMGVW